jgi:L-lactate utilization protein LutC
VSARDEILTRLRSSLANPGLRFPPPAPQPLTPSTRMAVTHIEGDRAELAHHFGAVLEALHASCAILDGPDKVAGALVQQIQHWRDADPEASEEPTRVLSWSPEALPVAGLDETLAAAGIQLTYPGELRSEESREGVQPIRFGLTGIEAAFATTGSIVVRSGPGTSRAASLLPLHHVALVPLSRLYPSVEGWLAGTRNAGNLADFIRASANLAVISGPSKSADIEGILTLGVHGPQFLHAILFDDVGG